MVKKLVNGFVESFSKPISKILFEAARSLSYPATSAGLKRLISFFVSSILAL